MLKKLIPTLFVLILISFNSNATHKVYLVHGYAGLGIELEKLQNTIENQGYTCEIFKYPSLSQDIEITAKHLFYKIKQENYDSVSFVTHSLGALVVRSLYQYVDSETHYPFIYRFVMIASPNQGSPIADFWAQFGFVKYIVGPNVDNLTTDPDTGAAKFPIPTCEVGLIAGITGKKTGFNIFIIGDNDGIVPAKNTKIGIEKDVAYVNASHVALVLNNKVIKLVIDFLENGYFSKNKFN
jgi:hypothetical protein